MSIDAHLLLTLRCCLWSSLDIVPSEAGKAPWHQLVFGYHAKRARSCGFQTAVGSCCLPFNWLAPRRCCCDRRRCPWPQHLLSPHAWPDLSSCNSCGCLAATPGLVSVAAGKDASQRGCVEQRVHLLNEPTPRVQAMPPISHQYLPALPDSH